MVRVPTHRARRLERFLGVAAQFRLNLQLAWDLDHASHSVAARQIAKIEPLKTDAAGRPASTKRRVAAAKRAWKPFHSQTER